jgi:hypothetical protein
MAGNRKSIARASVNPVSLGVAGAAATLAIGLGSVPLAVLGGLAYVTMVAFDAMTPAKRAAPTAVVTSLPEPKSLTDESTREALEKIVASKKELERVLDETPPDVLANLSTTLSSVHAIDSYAARLIGRGEDIAKHLAGVNLASLVEEVKDLSGRAEGTSDPDAKKTFEEAKAARMDELRTLKELKKQKDRIDANLMRIVAVLGSLPTKVVHMRALDAQAMDRISGDMNEELEAVGQELKTSEEVIKQVGEVTQ